MNYWDERFLDLAEWWANKCSKDPSTKVGCVLALGKGVVSLGYNGFPAGVDDSEERYFDREVKYRIVQHAETNAIHNSFGRAAGTTAYVTHQPCAHCSGALIQAGIVRIVSWKPEAGLAERFKDSFEWAEIILKEAGVNLDLYEKG